MIYFDTAPVGSKTHLRPSKPFYHTMAIDDLARWLDNVVAPDVYAVVHLRKSHDGVMGNRIQYEKAACDLMTRLSKAVYGKKAFKRRPHGKRLIPNFITLEQADERPHLNILIRRPDHIDLVSFSCLMQAFWLTSPWAVTEEDVWERPQFKQGAFWCEERQAGSNVVGYSLKEGTEALLEKSLSF